MSLTTIIDATRDAVAADTADAHALFRAEGTATGDVASTIRVGRHTVTVDEPPTLGGQDEAPNPVEFALVGLLSCQVVTYRFWAARLGIALETIDITTEGDLDVRGFFGLDEEVRSGFTEVRVNVTLGGPEPRERYVELHTAVDAHCPVLDLFSNATPVKVDLHTR